MLGLNKEKRDPFNEVQKPGNGILLQELRGKRLWQYLPDILLVLAMSSLLFYGYLSTGRFTNPHTDIARYECDAEAFWRGTPVLHWLPPAQCLFIKTGTTPTTVQRMKLHGWPAQVINNIESHQSPLKPLHYLPQEYPLLTIIPFSLGLVAHGRWYRVVFPLWMALVAAILYFILVRYRSREAAIAFAFYLVVGSWATAEGRYDLIPAGLTLIALMLAKHERWRWAFVALALATLFKFYALV